MNHASSHAPSHAPSHASYPIYLDYGATTPVDPRVVEAMIPWLHQRFGNASSGSHVWGWEADEAIAQARDQVAALIGAQAREIVWTSGATESTNLALKGAALAQQERGRHLITLQTEHKATLDSMQALQAQGFEATVLPVQSDGLLDLDVFKAALRPDTTLVSVLWVNNEIGVIQDIAAIGALCREHGALLHVDAAQATGRIAIDVQALPIDLMSMTAHKTYGPKGVGALYVRRKPPVRVLAQIHGGGHERGMRSGTLPTHQIVGMGAAFALAQQEMPTLTAHARALQQRLWAGLQDMEGIFVNGSMQEGQRVPQNLNLSFAGVEGEALLMGLSDLALSSGSACTSASLEPSHVLRALGRSDDLAHAALRITTGRFTTEAEIDQAIASIRACVARLRAISPLWPPDDACPTATGDTTQGSAGTLADGKVVQLHLEIDPITQTIASAQFKAYGCPHTIATMTWLAQWLEGKPRSEAAQLDYPAIVQAVNLPPLKIHCALLAQQALQAALADRA